jgi:hypothetical protein
VTEQTAEQCGRNRDKACGCPSGCPGVPLDVGSRTESTSYPKRTSVLLNSRLRFVGRVELNFEQTLICDN